MKKFLPKTVKNPSGFTLVELMVVIAIIAILSVIGFAVFANAQRNARDGRRRGDIDAILKALEINKGATTYQSLVNSQFAQGSVPTDPSANRTAEYCIISRIDFITPAKPTVWDNTQCPDSSATPSPISDGQPDNTPTNFQVCALLEIGENPDNIYCVSNQQ